MGAGLEILARKADVQSPILAKRRPCVAHLPAANANQAANEKRACDR
jgi:hypothetical protein